MPFQVRMWLEIFAIAMTGRLPYHVLRYCSVQSIIIWMKTISNVHWMRITIKIANERDHKLLLTEDIVVSICGDKDIFVTQEVQKHRFGRDDPAFVTNHLQDEARIPLLPRTGPWPRRWWHLETIHNFIPSTSSGELWFQFAPIFALLWCSICM